MDHDQIPGRWSDLLGNAEAQVLRSYQRPRDDHVDLVRSALLVIDVVESFLGPDVPVREAQRLARTACGELGWRAIPGIRALLAAFRRNSSPVIYTVIASGQGFTGAATAGQSRLDSGLPGDKVLDDVAPLDGELVLPKNKSSAFFGTPLLSALVRFDVRTLVLTGGTTSGCLLATAIDGSSYGFDVVVAADASFDRVPALADAALVTLDAKWARVQNVKEILAGFPRVGFGRTD